MGFFSSFLSAPTTGRKFSNMCNSNSSITAKTRVLPLRFSSKTVIGSEKCFTGSSFLLLMKKSSDRIKNKRKVSVCRTDKKMESSKRENLSVRWNGPNVLKSILLPVMVPHQSTKKKITRFKVIMVDKRKL